MLAPPHLRTRRAGTAYSANPRVRSWTADGHDCCTYAVAAGTAASARCEWSLRDRAVDGWPVQSDSNGQPLVILSIAVCAPTGTPLLIAATQTRVVAT
jgi:hypothetical protein